MGVSRMAGSGGEVVAVNASRIPALLPGNIGGHQFVVYGDSCSGVPGAIHEATTAAVNRVVAHLDPAPEFICFLGDEVIGLTTDEADLRDQWQYWFDVEMAWLDRERIPLFHTTANHTTYDAMSERVYADVMAHLPTNGPEDQRQLSYYVRRDDLLLVFVNTMWTHLGEGRVETAWLDAVLTDHADARSRLVFGHHPVFPINGFGGEYQREIEHANGERFWQVLVRHDVRVYFCSHMLAFDVKVVQGVLQVMTAGAGTKHRMPEEIEYLHAVQVALDADSLRYQVLDDTGVVRERLTWPPAIPPASTWPSTLSGPTRTSTPPLIEAWCFEGVLPLSPGGSQTLMSGRTSERGLPPIWVGLIGPEQRLSVLLSPQLGRSPGLWHGPTFTPGVPFSFQFAVHRGMGPGGMLWRWGDDGSWTSMTGTAPWGAERLPEIDQWSIGCSKGDPGDRPFQGTDLRVWSAAVA